MSEGSELDLEVLRRALADPHGEDFVAFFERYGPTVQWAVGVRAFGWPALTSSFADILQEVWVRILRDAERAPLLGYDEGRGTRFSRYLARHARRLAWKVCKPLLRHPPTEALDGEPEDESDFTQALIHLDESERVTAMLRAELDGDEAYFFEQHFIAGRPIQDVGAERGKPANASHQFKGRLAKKLVRLARKLLGLEPPDDDPTGEQS
jgi:DNA-directed RNA polymerase specialized sigma24 family protein